FSVNANGLMRLGSNQVSTDWTNSSTNAGANNPAIMPYWDDLHTGVGGSVRYVVTGTAPNRILKVEWFVTVPRNTSGNADGRFQAWLYESTNVIEFVYGALAANTTNSGYTIGIATSSSVYNTVNGSHGNS